MRLFLALTPPPELAQTLAAAVPARRPGLRPADVRSLHVTLHFLGERELGPVIDALGDVAVGPVDVQIDGAGQFPARDGGAVLWAAVAPSPGLLRLHHATAEALARVGFVPETRPYRPHVTLAFAAPGADPPQLSVPHLDWTTRDFTLYSSARGPVGPAYVERARFTTGSSPARVS